MTDQPHEGGSYLRGKDGRLVRIVEADQPATDPTSNQTAAPNAAPLQESAEPPRAAKPNKGK